MSEMPSQRDHDGGITGRDRLIFILTPMACCVQGQDLSAPSAAEYDNYPPATFAAGFVAYWVRHWLVAHN